MSARTERLARLGLPMAHGFTFMLRHAGGLWGCVRCQFWPYAMRHAKAERKS